MKIYSLLISGGNALQDGYNEFWNDLVDAYDTLRQLQTVTATITNNNIFTFYAQGDDYRYGACSRYNPVRADRTLEIPGLSRKKGSFTDYAANLSNIRKVMKWLKTQSFDMLVVWTLGHGFRHGNSSLLFVGGNTETLTDDEFAGLLSDIGCDLRIIFMQQCFSGGFIDKLNSSNSSASAGIGPFNIIMTACEKTEFAYRADAIEKSGAKKKPFEAYDEFEIHIDGKHRYYHGEFNFHLNRILGMSNILFPDCMEENYRADLEHAMEHAFDYVLRNDTTEESTQYLSPYIHKGTTPSPYKYSLKSQWSLGKQEDSLLLEFYYDISLMFEEEENKTIIFKLNNQYRHTFTVCNNTCRIQERPDNKFGLNGKITASYNSRQIFFEGFITHKAEDPYCPSQDAYASFYPRMDSKSGLECKIVLFSWL